MLSRRELFAYWFSWMRPGWNEGGPAGLAAPGQEFFASHERCYALLAEIPHEDLVREAQATGIDPDGRTKLELARAIFTGGSS